MAITETEVQIEWDAGGVTNSLGAGVAEDSDTITLDQTTIWRAVQVQANNGSSAAGDSVDVYWKVSLGDDDTDPTVSNTFPTDEHAIRLGRLICNTSDTGGENPARATWEVPPGGKEAQLYTVSNAASGSITVSATMLEKRSS